MENVKRYYTKESKASVVLHGKVVGYQMIRYVCRDVVDEKSGRMHTEISSSYAAVGEVIWKKQN